MHEHAAIGYISAMAFVDETVNNELRIRELTIAPRVGRERPVTGVVWQRPDIEPGMPLVCFGHGASGDRYQQPIPWLVEQLVGVHGFAALAIDGPVHGRRRVGDGGRDEFWSEWRRRGTVEDMNADWRQALDFAQAQYDIGAVPVGYWGLSMGTIYGGPLVAADQRIRASVLGLMGISGPSHYRPAIADAARRIDTPVLFIMQLEDELFPREDCLALFDELATADKRLHANAGLHPEVPIEELHHSVAFLAERLQAPG
ncbi:MAG: dienelactone hydrolase family protein [Acidimicrobiales bacterium]